MEIKYNYCLLNVFIYILFFMNSFYESRNVLTEAQCYLFHLHPPSVYRVYTQQRREVHLQELKTKYTSTIIMSFTILGSRAEY
jgi:hypothetical protein